MRFDFTAKRVGVGNGAGTLVAGGLSSLHKQVEIRLPFLQDALYSLTHRFQ